VADLVSDARAYVTRALRELADPDKATGMQAYMKTDMPFFGVQKPQRTPVYRHLIKEFPPVDRQGYEDLVLGLWELPHREEKYLALGVASGHRRFVVPDSIHLYRRLIVEGAWWDFVDTIATDLIRHLVLEYPDEVWEVVGSWVDDEDMWLRRTAILCQVGAKERTDPVRLFDFCLRRAHEKEFFIRKAIGWALREYAKTDPHAVADFAKANRDRLSGLSFREGTKHIQYLVEAI